MNHLVSLTKDLNTDHTDQDRRSGPVSDKELRILYIQLSILDQVSCNLLYQTDQMQLL